MDTVTQLWSRLNAQLPGNRLTKTLIIGGFTGSVVSLGLILREDYKAFLALGPGGPPYNVFGWLIVTIFLRPVALSAKNATWTGDYPDSGAHEDVVALPTRKGPRPTVAGIAPHRQKSQNAPEAMRKNLQSLFTTVQSSNPDLVETKTSHYENHLPALYIHPTILASNSDTLPPFASAATGEIGHIHGDLSTHLYFSPADAKLVITKGWGERHRLARRPPWNSKLTHTFGLGYTYLTVYGPRDEEELQVYKTLLRNSVKYMVGEKDVRGLD